MSSRARDRSLDWPASLAARVPLREVDTRGTYCPGPLLETIRLVRESEIGDTVAIVSGGTDAGRSIPAWVARAGHGLTIEDLPGGRRYLVTRRR